jgi:hypothetical protein
MIAKKTRWLFSIGGYEHQEAKAVRNKKLVAIDEDKQLHLTHDRIKT